MISPAATVSTLWTVWVLGWLLASRATARTVTRQSAASRLTHTALMWGGAVFLFLRFPRLGVLSRPFLQPHAWVVWLGVALVAIGLGFTAWARIHLGRFWSGAVTLKAEHSLIRTGPYALVRHPIYTGLLLALAGTALVHGTFGALVGFTLITTGIMLKIRQEEHLLIGHFGSGYLAYKAAVPAVVPRFWPHHPE